MNILDIVLVLILAFFTIRGFLRGLLMELAAITGLVLGFWVANSHSDLLLPIVGRAMNDPTTAHIVAYILTLLAVMLAVWLVGFLLRTALKAGKLSGMDHLFGSIFGFIKGALLGAILVMVLIVNSSDSGVLRESTLQPYLGGVSDWLADYLPNGLKKVYHDNAAGLRRAADGFTLQNPA
ncbi:MAG: CvpA family protein [Desulfocurvibacter africanus]